eukprot:jgi/Bigna1/91178/estExt_fgenesh1_pg.C_910080
MSTPIPSTSVKLKVAPSLIPGAGKGLFAIAPFRKGSEICRYTGTVLSLADLLLKRVTNTDYVMGLSLRVHIDAQGHPEVLARYINDIADTKKRNATFVKIPKEKMAKVVALRDIRPGEEIYASYGEGYWRKRGGFPSEISRAAEQKNFRARVRCGAFVVISFSAVLCFISHIRRLSLAA